MSGFSSALDHQLAALQSGLNSALSTAASIPFVGNHLGGTQAVQTFISGIQSKIDTQLQEEVGDVNPSAIQIQQVLTDALGPQGLNLLQGIVHVTDQGGGSFSVEAHLHVAAGPAGTPVQFATGLPGLPFSVKTNGSIDLSVGFDYELAFQFDASTQAVGLDSAQLNDFGANGPAHQMAVDVTASLPYDASNPQDPDNFQASISLGVLYGTAQPVPGEANGFNGAIYLDNFANPGALSFGGGTGGANVNLLLNGGLGADPSVAPQIPSLTAQFHLNWDFGSDNPPDISFDNVGIDLGTLISSVIGPAINDIQTVTQPIEPLIKVLRYPLPGISELSNFLGQGDVTLESLLDTAATTIGFGPVASLVDTVLSVVNAVNQFQVPSDNKVILTFPGTFSIDTVDGPNLEQPVADPDSIQFGPEPSYNAQTAISDAINNSGLDATTQAKLDGLAKSIFDPGISIQYPIVDDPAQVVLGLLVGQHPDLVSLNLDASRHLSGTVASGFSIFGLGVDYQGDLGLDAHLHLGYDTYGLEELLSQAGSSIDAGTVLSDFGDGFYVAKTDQAMPDINNPNVYDVLQLSADAYASAGVSIGFAGVSLKGGIYTGQQVDGWTKGSQTTAINFTLDPSKSPTNDGRIRFKDASSALSANGQLNAGLNVLLTIGVNTPFGFLGYQKPFNIAQVTLLDLTGAKPPSLPPLATYDESTSTLTLNTKDASLGDQAGTTENFTVELAPGFNFNDTLVVSLNGQSQTFPGVSQIVATGDQQNLNVTVGDGVSASATLKGGNGPAQLTYLGDGTANLTAGGTDSVLKGGPGINNLYAGSGSDVLYGGTGTNNFYYGTGANTTTTFVVPASSKGDLIWGRAPSGGNEVMEMVGTRLNAARIYVGPVPFLTGYYGVFYQDNNNQGLTVGFSGITTLLLAPATGVSNVEIGDMSNSGLRSLQLSVTASYLFAPVNVTIDGSSGDDEFDLNDRLVEDQLGKAYALATEVTLLNPGQPFKQYDIFGLSRGDHVTLDGGGGNNSFYVTPSSQTPLNVTIAHTGAAGSDLLYVSGIAAQRESALEYSVPTGTNELVTVTGSSVTFYNSSPTPVVDDGGSTWLSNLGGTGRIGDSVFISSGFFDDEFNSATVNFGSSVQALDVYTAIGDPTQIRGQGTTPPTEVDVSGTLAVGQTAIVGGNTNNTFNIGATTQGGDLILDGSGAPLTAFNINTPTVDSNISVQDSGHQFYGYGYTTAGDDNMLSFNDQTNPAYNGATYQITGSQITRADNYVSYLSTTTVNYSNITSLNIYGGNHGNVYNVQSTPAGAFTTIGCGGGQDEVDLQESDDALGSVISSLLVSGQLNGTGTAGLNLDDSSVQDQYGAFGLSLSPLSGSYAMGYGELSRTETFLQFFYDSHGNLDGAIPTTSSIDVTYRGLSSVTIKDSPSTLNPSDFTLTNTGATAETIVSLQRPGDTVQIGDNGVSLAGGPHDLEHINNVSVQGSAGSTLKVDNEADTATFSPDSVHTDYRQSDAGYPLFTITGYYLTFQDQGTEFVSDNPTGPANFSFPFAISSTIRFSNISSLSVQGSTNMSLRNTFDVVNSVMPVTIIASADAGAGSSVSGVDGTPLGDFVNIGDRTFGMDPVAGTVTVHGAGNTVLNLNDQPNNVQVVPGGPIVGSTYTEVPHPTFTISDGMVQRRDHVVNTTVGGSFDFLNTIVYDNLARMFINGGQAANEYDVQQTDIPVDITAGPSTDLVKIGDSQHSLNGVAGPVTVWGNANTTMILDDTITQNYFSKVVVPYYLDNSVAITVDGATITRTNQETLTIADPTLPPATQPPPFVSTITQYGVGQVVVVGASPGNTYDGNPSGTTFSINSTNQGTSTTIQTGADGDVVNVGGPTNSLDFVAGPVTVIGAVTVMGGGPNTTLNVNDSGTTTSENYSVSPTSIQRSIIVAGFGYDYNTAPINYYQVGKVAVYVGSAQTGVNLGAVINTLDVFGTQPGTTTDLYGNNSGGQTQFAISPYESSPPQGSGSGTYNANNQLLGAVHYHASSRGLDTVTYYDYLDQAAQSYAMTAGQIVDKGFAPLTYDGRVYGAALFTAEAGGSTVSLSSTGPGGLLTHVLANTGDVVTVGSQAPALGGSLSQMGEMILQTIGAAQSATFILDDSGDPNPETASYYNDGYAPGFSGLSPSRIYFFTVGTGSNVQVRGGTNPANSLTATFSGDFDQNWTVSGFSTSSGFTVPGNFSGQLLASGLGTAAQPIQQFQVGGSMTAAAKIKVNYLSTLSVAGDLAGTVYGYGPSKNQKLPTIGTVTIGGNFSGTITAPVIGKINQRSASSSFFSGHVFETTPGMDLQSLVLGTVTSTAVIQAGEIDSATVAGDMAGQMNVSGPLGNLSVGGNLTGTVSATTIGSISIGQNMTGNVSASQSIGSVQAGGTMTGSVSAPAIQQATVNGTAAGNDTFALTPSSVVLNGTTVLSGTFGSLAVHGGNGNDLFQIEGGVVPATITAGTGNDTFQFFTGASITGALDGGSGTNTLDYSQFAGNILVDLLLGSATGVGGGIANIQVVKGSQGNDMIVGNANPSTLVGGTGRNVLIGGAGMATLDASHATGDNILIGGTTNWDRNVAALEAIMAEWDRTDLGFSDRRSDLLNGTNGQGKTPLNIVNGQLILLAPSTNPTSSNGTVHANAFADALIGSSATDPATGRRAHNWFLYARDDVIENYVNSSDKKDHIT